MNASSDDSHGSGSGFSARVEGVQLADLIQMKCMNRGRAACRVLSRGTEGHLFFEDGRVVHADFGAAVGVEAVAHMLALGTGTFEPCALAWPPTPSLDLPGDALLLYAAQRLDDLQRAGFRLPSEPPPTAPVSEPSPSAPRERPTQTRHSGAPSSRRTGSGTFLYRGKRY